MAYFVDISGQIPQVVVLPPRTRPPDTCVEINRETAIACDLRNGQRLSPEQLAALQAKSVSGFHAAWMVDPSQHGAFAPAPPVASAAAFRPAQMAGQPLPAPVAPRSVGAQVARQSNTARRANSVAGVVEGICWLFLLASIALGAAVAAQSRVSGFSGETEHPYVAAGIAIAIVGSFEALVVIMFATYIKARTEP